MKGMKGDEDGGTLCSKKDGRVKVFFLVSTYSESVL